MKKSMEFFNKRARDIWKNKIITSCEKIQEVKQGKCKYNFQCHRNAIHEAINNKDDKLAIVFYIDWDDAILHYINYTNWEYIDNTLWFWSKFNDFYFYKWLNKEDFGIEWLELFSLIREEFRLMIPSYYRYFVNETI